MNQEVIKKTVYSYKDVQNNIKHFIFVLQESVSARLNQDTTVKKAVA